MAAVMVEQPQNIQLDKDEKNCEGFRNFNEGTALYDRVFNTYLEMHTKQCVEYVQQKHKEYLSFNHGKFSIMEALDELEDFVDASDPDVDFPNSYHAYQTAEGLREQYPDLDWLHLTGLIHDLGKMMGKWGEPQFSTVGDTYIVGAEFAPSIVYRENTFHNNPDTHNPKYQTKYGIYEANCGLNNVLMSWGHDEYMYQVLKHNKTKLPDIGLYCIRFHSFYPWHTGGDYGHFCSEKDMEMKEWIHKFNAHDLYSKSEVLPDVEKLKPYYQSLIDKYMPGKLEW